MECAVLVTFTRPAMSVVLLDLKLGRGGRNGREDRRRSMRRWSLRNSNSASHGPGKLRRKQRFNGCYEAGEKSRRELELEV